MPDGWIESGPRALRPLDEQALGGVLGRWGGGVPTVSRAVGRWRHSLGVPPTGEEEGRAPPGGQQEQEEQEKEEEEQE